MYKTAVRLRLQRESPDLDRRLREALADWGENAWVDVVADRLVHVGFNLSADLIEDAVKETIERADNAISAATKAGYAILHVEATA